MIIGIILIFIFIIGFAFGIAMPFILKKMNIYEVKDLKLENQKNEKETQNNAHEIMDEWLNGKRGE